MNSKELAFPERFEFFDLGKVESRSTKKYAELRAPFIVIFRVIGDDTGHCAVAFNHLPRTGEESMLIEMANILVSKFITQVSEVSNGYSTISPPEALQSPEGEHRRISAMLQNAPEGAAQRRYEFIRGRVKIDLNLFYLPTPTSEA